MSETAETEEHGGEYIPKAASKRRNATASRMYSDNFRLHAVALVEYRGGHESLNSIANAIDVPVDTLRKWYYGQLSQRCQVLREKTREDMKKEMERLLWLYLESLVMKMPDANAHQSAKVIDILFQKIQLMEGKPTAIQATSPNNPLGVPVSDLTDEELDDLYRLAQRIDQRRATVHPVIPGRNHRGEVPPQSADLSPARVPASPAHENADRRMVS